MKEPVSVILDIATLDAAMQYAEGVVKTVDYSRRNQVDKQKIVEDHFVGKLGEAAVEFVLQTMGIEVGAPDYEIYESRRKSWDSDLFIGDLGIAVKTQKLTTAYRFGLSWTFHFEDPILQQPEAIVYYVVYNDQIGNWLTVFPGKKIKDTVFGSPAKDILKNVKRVVYGKDNGYSLYMARRQEGPTTGTSIYIS